MSERKPLVHDVANLSDYNRQLIERQLTAGATFEDVVDAVNHNDQGEGVTQKAVEEFFRNNVPLQQARIRAQLELARALKEATGNPQSAEGELAEAVIMTGLMRLNRPGSQLDVNDAVRQHLQRRNQDLKEQVFRVNVRLLRTRLKHELVKLELTRVRVAELRRAVEAHGGASTFGPEMVQRIQEIYGLVNESTQSTGPSVAA